MTLGKSQREPLAEVIKAKAELGLSARPLVAL
jgi:hypothetical protein